jgi:hypothetical protein
MTAGQWGRRSWHSRCGLEYSRGTTMVRALLACTVLMTLALPLAACRDARPSGKPVARRTAETETPLPAARVAPAPAPAGQAGSQVVTGPVCGTSTPTPAPSAGEGASAGGGVAVVVLMLPGIGGSSSGAAGLGADGRRADARSYKVSLSADAETATIDVDGRRLARAPIQRVAPGDHQRFVVRSSSPGGIATAEIVPPNPDSLKARQMRRPPSPPRLSLDPQPEILNPNGAPIID